ncbi:hypothetical protein D6C79_10411, partial [Aureobasidium pullulans]
MWPTQPPPLTPQAQALLWMLKALKAATEAYIEQPIQYIVITNPLPLESSPTYHSTISSSSPLLSSDLVHIAMWHINNEPERGNI